MALTSPATLSPYDGISVAVPNDGQPHQLLELLRGVNPRCANRAKYYTVQNDPDLSNDSALFGAADLDDEGSANPAKLTSSNYGVKLQKGSSETFSGFRDEDFNIARVWVMTTGAGTVQLNVQVIRG